MLKTLLNFFFLSREGNSFSNPESYYTKHKDGQLFDHDLFVLSWWHAVGNNFPFKLSIQIQLLHLIITVLFQKQIFNVTFVGAQTWSNTRSELFRLQMMKRFLLFVSSIYRCDLYRIVRVLTNEQMMKRFLLFIFVFISVCTRLHATFNQVVYISARAKLKSNIRFFSTLGSGLTRVGIYMYYFSQDTNRQIV